MENLCSSHGVIWGNIRVVLGLYRDNGKDNGNYIVNSTESFNRATVRFFFWNVGASQDGVVYNSLDMSVSRLGFTCPLKYWAAATKRDQAAM